MWKLPGQQSPSNQSTVFLLKINQQLLVNSVEYTKSWEYIGLIGTWILERSRLVLVPVRKCVCVCVCVWVNYTPVAEDIPTAINLI